MDVASYRKFNKPGWVCAGGILGNHGFYISCLRSDTVFSRHLEEAEAFADIDEANRVCLIIARLGYRYAAVPIPDLPNKDASEEIKQELRHVVESIGQFDSTSLTYYGISVKLYDLICQIVDQKLEKR